MESARAAPVDRPDLSRILRLAFLARDIIEAILGGWADQRVVLEKLERPLPVAWSEQRVLLRNGWVEQWANLAGPDATTGTAFGRSQFTASPPRAGARDGTGRGA